MKYLFDTDLISTLMIGRASARLLARLAAIGADNQAISSITALEIFYGAYKTADPQRFLSLFEEKVLSNVVVLPFDDTAARLAGRIRAEREAEGRPIAPIDLQIAATALASGRILVTGNINHFSGIGSLDVQNWL
ncbi:MAG: PIN domain-containing protein [Rectinemataceae bacterium]|nr:PIN domain-containing protein [Rectinemataceae bacterium]